LSAIRRLASVDNRPIGVFDSGLGGLTAVKVLLDILPNERIIYFGDTGRVPYGTRSDQTIIKYVRQDIRFLQTFDIKAILVACGTASAVALSTVAQDCPVPLLGVVQPAAEKAASVSKNRRVGVIGTPGTIRSGAYRRALLSLDSSITVFESPAPLFVPLVENGYFDKSSQVCRLVAQDYLSPIKKAGVDTLILGCTHYPLLRGIIADIMGDGVHLVDPGAEMVSLFARYLKERDMQSEEGAGGLQCFVSDDIGNFTALASIFLQRSISGDITLVNIENY